MKNISGLQFLKQTKKCFYQTLSDLSALTKSDFRFSILGQEFVVVNQPEHMRDLILKNQSKLIKGRTLSELTALTKGLKTITESDGIDWSQLRTTLQPSFHKDFVDNAIKLIPAIMNELELAINKKNHFLDLQDLMSRLALRCICEMLLSEKIDCFKDLEKPFLYLENQKYLVEQLSLRMKYGSLWKYLPIPSNFKVIRCVDQNDHFLQSVIDRRRQFVKLNSPDKNFLDVLMSLKTKDGEIISDELVKIHVYGFLGAAYESTSSVLHWALCYLATNEDKQNLVRDEAKKYLSESTVQSDSLKYCQNVIYEAMRLYPPFPILIRECAEDILLPLKIKKGAFVFNMIGLSQKDKTIWGANAEEFSPERFQDLSQLQKENFYPFGLGKRVCIGESLARTELPVLLAHLTSRFKFTLAENKIPKSQLKFSLQPEAVTLMKFQKLESI